MIYVCTKDAINRSPPKIVESRSFKNYNKFAFRRDLYDTLNSANIEKELDPNKMWEIWKNVFTSSGEASPTFGHANANFSVFTDRIRINF